eukprot:768550-Hanusia_phi.AAC.4
MHVPISVSFQLQRYDPLQPKPSMFRCTVNMIVALHPCSQDEVLKIRFLGWGRGGLGRYASTEDGKMMPDEEKGGGGGGGGQLHPVPPPTTSTTTCACVMISQWDCRK